MKIEFCPGCGSRSLSATNEAPGFSVTVSSHEFVQEQYGVADCLTCGLLYRTHCLSQDQFFNYYDLTDFSRWEINGYFPTERAVLRALRRLNPGARILDFGCSSGRLLAGLVNCYECFGFEINDAAASTAGGKGLKMLSESRFSEFESGFDAVALMDVFEHLPTPTDTLQQLFALLKPGGILIVVTGNGDHRSCRRDPGLFWYFRIIEHTCMLTRQYATWVATRFGANLIGWTSHSHYDTKLIEKAIQLTQEFAFWQFRQKTLVSRMVLSGVPFLRRARCWPMAPKCSSRKDHIMAIFQRNPV